MIKPRRGSVIPSRTMRRACIAAIILAVSATPAHAYEFWLRTRTIGQAYQLRSYRLLGPDLFLGRRRYTQTLALRIFDVGNLSEARRRARLPDRGVRITWQSYLRIDHDFGSYSNGRIRLTELMRRDAIDVIPELAESVAELDLLYGHLEVTGIADDRVSLQLGRVLVDDGWGTSAIDGATARVELPDVPLAVKVASGLRVRAATPLGVSAYELDGTSGAGCREYVEGAMPGTGTWQLVDRDRRITNTRLESDYEYCPQREVWQPTIGAALVTSRTRGIGAELGYRRTWSSTVGLIGPADRLDFEDRGLYPNDFGQAPERGINEERLHARVHGELAAGPLTIRPHASARYSLLHATLDRADLGVRLQRGAHVVEPVLEYFSPTFDGDSIFNVFAIEATADARVGYRYDGTVRATANGWLRRYAGSVAYAGGLDASVERVLTDRWRARLDGQWDDGYGGRRVGGGGEAAWRARRDLWLRGRVIVLGVAPDDHRPRYVTSGTVLSSTVRLGDNAALHLIGEGAHDALHDLQIRALAVLDLAFTPEP